MVGGTIKLEELGMEYLKEITVHLHSNIKNGENVMSNDEHGLAAK